MLDHPRSNRDVIFIAQLEISTLLLFRDQRFRGYSVLSFDPWDATSLEALNTEEYAAFFMDVRTASQAMRQALKPDHMNYALLGNTTPHLHWHIVPRYKSDPRWGQPVWEEYGRNEFTINRHVVSDSEYHDTVMAIRQALADVQSTG